MCQAELSLDQMLSDVIVQTLMRRDGVTEAEIRSVMASIARRHATEPAPILVLCGRECPPAPRPRTVGYRREQGS